MLKNFFGRYLEKSRLLHELKQQNQAILRHYQFQIIVLLENGKIALIYADKVITTNLIWGKSRFLPKKIYGIDHMFCHFAKSSKENKLAKFYLIFIWQRVPALNDDKHVIDANAKQQKWYHIVHGAKRKSNNRAQAVRDQQAHDYSKDSNDGKVDSLFHAVKSAEHGHHIYKNNHEP